MTELYHGRTLKAPFGWRELVPGRLNVGLGLYETLLVAAAVAVAFCSEAVVGFGATLFALAIAGFAVPIDELLPIVVPLNVGLSAWLVVRDFHKVQPAYLLRRICPVLVAGLPAGFLIALLTAGSDKHLLERLFGIFVLAVGLVELRRTLRNTDSHVQTRAVSRRAVSPESMSSSIVVLPSDAQHRHGSDSKFWGNSWRIRRLGALFLAGIAHGLFASGGPMVVYVAAKDGLPQASFRSTLALLWLVVNSVMVVLYGLSGRSSAANVRGWIFLLLAVLLGIFVGEILSKRVNKSTFEKAVFATLCLAGFALALKA